MRRPVALTAVGLALATAGCGGGSDSTPAASTPASTPAASTPAASTPAPAPQAQPAPAQPANRGCRPASQPPPKPAPNLRPPRQPLDPARRWTATVRTSCGSFQIALDTRQQPRTATSFAALARRGFYDRLTFHRIAHLPDGSTWVIQGGDPTGDGTGGPGYTIVEAPPRRPRYVRGTVAMAKTGSDPAGASGSQFFVVVAPDAGLPPQYAILGHVVGGMDAVRRIGAVPSSPETEQPLAPVVIDRVTVSSR